MFAKILNHKSFLLFSIILFAANIFFLKLPLVNVFGFEFSILNGVILCILTGLFRLAYLRKLAKLKPKSISFFKQSIFLLAIPFAVSIINSLFTGFCSFCDGIIFYLLIALVSAFIGIAIATLAYSFIKSIIAYPVFIVLILFILSISFFEIYNNPQIYLYNPIFGYFPGTIYDEGLRPFWKLFSYRLLNFLYFGIIFFLFRASARITLKTKFIRLGVVTVIAVLFYYINPVFGYTTTHSSLINNLPVKIESEHIILNTDKIDREDSLLILSGEYYYSELQKYFNQKINHKINIYLFESGEQKKKLFGSENADVAKPWLTEVYLSRQNWQPTLKHEIAHCFTAPIGITIFKIASDINPALIEGAAESADGFYDGIPIHYLAKTAFKHGYKVNLEKLFTPGFSFFNQNSSLSYIYAGSFCKYLVENYGIDKFKKFYKNGFSDSIYSKSLNQTVHDYKLFLDTLNYETNANVANYYFGSPGIFSKYCPRYYEDKISEAWIELKKNKYENAKENFEQLLMNSNNYSALIGLISTFENLKDINSAIDIVQSRLKDYEKSAYYYLLKLKLADLEAKNLNYKISGEMYKKLINAAPSNRIKFICLIRTTLLSKSNSMLNKYLRGSDFDKYLILKKVNQSRNNYFTFPVMIELSQRVEEDYQLFLGYFENRIEVQDYWSSFATIKLSEYMYFNFDFINARKISTLALRYNSEPELYLYAKANAKKQEWVYKNHEKIFDNLKTNKFN